MEYEMKTRHGKKKLLCQEEDGKGLTVKDGWSNTAGAESLK